MWFIVVFFKHFFQSSTFAFVLKKNVWFPIQKDPCPKGPPRQALKECVSTWHLGCEFGIDDGWCREDDEWWYWVDGYHQGYLTARFNFTQLPSMLVASTGHQSQLRLHFFPFSSPFKHAQLWPMPLMLSGSINQLRSTARMCCLWLSGPMCVTQVWLMVIESLDL